MSDRYKVQETFHHIGREGQQRLSQAKAVVVGVGGLGSFLCQYLVRSGVGHLRIIDFDEVDISNLQRQILYDEGDLGESKVKRAFQHLKSINSEVEIEPVDEKVTSKNAEQLLTGFDLVLDGSDNYKARFLMNDVAKKYKIPFIFGSVAGAYGMSKVFLPDEPICLRDVVGNVSLDQAPTAATGGLINPILGVVTGFMAAEALKILTGNIPMVERRLMIFDLWQNQWSQLQVSSDPNCVVCQGKSYPALEGD
jgi:adenylyltransferase/sulfurtransferase